MQLIRRHAWWGFLLVALTIVAVLCVFLLAVTAPSFFGTPVD